MLISNILYSIEDWPNLRHIDPDSFPSDSVDRVLRCSRRKYCSWVWVPAQERRYYGVQRRYRVPSLNTGTLASTRWTELGAGRKCLELVHMWQVGLAAAHSVPSQPLLKHLFWGEVPLWLWALEFLSLITHIFATLYQMRNIFFHVPEPGVTKGLDFLMG